jgi:hypothetical protein
MKRRDFLRAALGTGAAMSGAGCLGLGGGNGNEEDDQVGHRITDEGGEGQYLLNRIDFVDQAGTLGQVDHMSNDQEVDNLVNSYSEGDWEEMDDNDLEVAERILNENDASVEEIRPWVEDALNRDLDEMDTEGVDAPPGPEEPDERALIYGIGRGISDETLISNSVDAAETIKPLAQKFASEYLDNEFFDAWISSATLPATNGRFTHLPITVAYSTENGFNVDYIEDGVPSTPGLPGDDSSIRGTGESVYSDPDELEYVASFEYGKALEAADQGLIEQEDGGVGDEIHPTRAISTALLGDLWSIVDSTRNDLSYENGPPNGIVTHVSKEFGRSIGEAINNPNAEKMQYMENVGRGIQLFYENKDLRSNLAVGGTLEQPDFYEFPDGMKDKLWNFEYDDLSQLEG